MSKHATFERLKALTQHNFQQVCNLQRIMTAISMGEPIYTKTIKITDGFNVIISTGDGGRVSSRPGTSIGNALDMDVEYSGYPYAYILDLLDTLGKRKQIAEGTFTYPKTIGKEYLLWERL